MGDFVSPKQVAWLGDIVGGEMLIARPRISCGVFGVVDDKFVIWAILVVLTPVVFIECIDVVSHARRELH
jgi:hypothetical protein